MKTRKAERVFTSKDEGLTSKCDLCGYGLNDHDTDFKCNPINWNCPDLAAPRPLPCSCVLTVGTVPCNLHATAPEMLRQLKGCLTVIKSCEIGSKIQDSIKATIAKAEGK